MSQIEYGIKFNGDICPLPAPVKQAGGAYACSQYIKEEVGINPPPLLLCVATVLVRYYHFQVCSRVFVRNFYEIHAALQI